MIDFETVKGNTVGRWAGIFQHFGISVGDGRHTYCPVCRGEKKHFRCDDKNGRGTWICTCGSGDGWGLLQEVLRCDFKEAINMVAPIVGGMPTVTVAKEKPTNPKKLRELFQNSKPVKVGDLVSQYLKSRGLDMLPKMLRLTSRCYELETKKEMPAMLGVVSAPDSEAITIHRTYLDPITASKAKIDKPKKLMPGLKKITGGAIRLFEPESGTLGVAEGIETAIACMQKFYIPTWATVSSSVMESFVPPKGIKKIYVFGDNDKNYAGQKAAYKLANRLVLKNKIETDVVIPEMLGDWLDNLNE